MGVWNLWGLSDVEIVIDRAAKQVGVPTEEVAETLANRREEERANVALRGILPDLLLLDGSECVGQGRKVGRREDCATQWAQDEQGRGGRQLGQLLRGVDKERLVPEAGGRS